MYDLATVSFIEMCDLAGVCPCCGEDVPACECEADAALDEEARAWVDAHTE